MNATTNSPNAPAPAPAPAAHGTQPPAAPPSAHGASSSSSAAPAVVNVIQLSPEDLANLLGIAVARALAGMSGHTATEDRRRKDRERKAAKREQAHAQTRPGSQSQRTACPQNSTEKRGTPKRPGQGSSRATAPAQVETLSTAIPHGTHLPSAPQPPASPALPPTTPAANAAAIVSPNTPPVAGCPHFCGNPQCATCPRNSADLSAMGPQLPAAPAAPALPQAARPAIAAATPTPLPLSPSLPLSPHTPLSPAHPHAPTPASAGAATHPCVREEAAKPAATQFPTAPALHAEPHSLQAAALSPQVTPRETTATELFQLHADAPAAQAATPVDATPPGPRQRRSTMADTSADAPHGHTAAPTTSAENTTPKKPRKNRKLPAADEPWLQELEANEGYAGIHIRRELGKMQAYCALHGVAPSRARFLNWLNRAERVIAHPGTRPPARHQAYQRPAQVSAEDSKF